MTFIEVSGTRVRIAVLRDVTVRLVREGLEPAGLWRAKLSGTQTAGGTGPTEPCEGAPDFILGPDGTLAPAIC